MCHNIPVLFSIGSTLAPSLAMLFVVLPHVLLFLPASSFLSFTQDILDFSVSLCHT